MMRRTTWADQQQIIALKKAGQSHQFVSEATGWSTETVRKVWNNHRRAEKTGLPPVKVGRPATGPLSTFDPLVRYVALRRKLERPNAGPDVILADMAVRRSLRGLRLPSSSSLGIYFSSFGDRLVTPVVICNCLDRVRHCHQPLLHTNVGCWISTNCSIGQELGGPT